MFHNNFKPSPDLIVALCNLIRLFLDNQLSKAKYDISALSVVFCTSMKYLNGGGGGLSTLKFSQNPLDFALCFSG